MPTLYRKTTTPEGKGKSIMASNNENTSKYIHGDQDNRKINQQGPRWNVNQYRRAMYRDQTARQMSAAINRGWRPNSQETSPQNEASVSTTTSIRIESNVRTQVEAYSNPTHFDDPKQLHSFSTLSNAYVSPSTLTILDDSLVHKNPFNMPENNLYDISLNNLFTDFSQTPTADQQNASPRNNGTSRVERLTTLHSQHGIGHNRRFDIIDDQGNKRSFTVAKLVKSGYTVQNILNLEQQKQQEQQTDPRVSIATLRDQHGIGHNRRFDIVDDQGNKRSFTVAKLVKSGYTVQNILNLEQQKQQEQQTDFRVSIAILRDQYGIGNSRRFDIVDDQGNKRHLTVFELVKSGYTVQNILNLEQQYSGSRES
jgi:hypothetical protein